MADGSELRIRRAEPHDRPAAVALCRSALGWSSGDLDERFFAWKHEENSAGPSPMWLAESDGELVGVRVFLRWRFTDGAESLLGVRAVDTATHPDWQGRGIFRKLTLGALPDLRDDGVAFVFNTPNTKSRPGYLKMGWGEVGNVPVRARVGLSSIGFGGSGLGGRGFGGTGFAGGGPVAALRRLASARTAALKWSEPTDVGQPAAEVLADRDAVRRLVERPLWTPGANPAAIRTERSPEYLHWRYRFDELRYRVVPVGDRVEDGLVIFRLRRRGQALECTVADTLVPIGPGVQAAERAVRSTLRTLARSSGADVLLAGMGVPGCVPVRQLGPILTWKPIGRSGVPPFAELALSMGDVELF